MNILTQVQMFFRVKTNAALNLSNSASNAPLERQLMQLDIDAVVAGQLAKLKRQAQE